MSDFSSQGGADGRSGLAMGGAVEKASHARELELKIIQQTLQRSKDQQIDEINKSFKWELEALKQELTSEAEGRIGQDMFQQKKAMELRLLQQEEFIRKDIELKGEKIKRSYLNQLDSEKVKMEQDHRDQLAQVKDSYEKKIQISK